MLFFKQPNFSEHKIVIKRLMQ